MPEIAHVLFLDIVRYSKESTTSQSRLIGDLTRLVKDSPAYQEAKSKGRVLPLPTGDGIALLFFDDVFAPARCAIELAENVGEMKVRMGIHSGLVQRQADISGSENVVGEGINTAQRIMDAADEGHILLSSQYAAWLEQFEQWSAYVHPLGAFTTKHGEELIVFNFCSDTFGRIQTPAKVKIGTTSKRTEHGRKIVILYRRKTSPDDEVLTMLESSLQGKGHYIFIDRHLKIGVEWAKAIEQQIRAADVVLAILSDAATGSEMLEYEIDTAIDEQKKRGKPFLLPIRVGTDKIVEGPLGVFVNGLNFSIWHGPQDNHRVVAEVVSAITEPPAAKPEEHQLEPVGGAMSPTSEFYIERDTDLEFAKALRAGESILLVKGPRQIGKTSLLGRGARLVKELGLRSTVTDFQKLSSSHLASDETFYRLLASTLARQLKIDYDFESEWLDVFGANMNMDNFVRHLLEISELPIVWFMDEADKLFGVPFASDFFGLVRSWHNSRATEPDGPWSRFTVVIGYATEAHLFIEDLNQSPFNVGRQFPLKSFTLGQTKDLNDRYGSPLSQTQVEELWNLIGGQPFLTRRALDHVARGTSRFETLMESATRDDGPFGDHLKRIIISVSQLPEVLESLKSSMKDPKLQGSSGIHRLVAAGVAVQSSDGSIALSCELYRSYLASRI